MLPTSESYVPRRYRFDPSWIVSAHVAIAMALKGPGQCKGRTTGSFNRTTFEGVLAKLKQFKNLVRYQLQGCGGGTMISCPSIGWPIYVLKSS